MKKGTSEVIHLEFEWSLFTITMLQVVLFYFTLLYCTVLYFTVLYFTLLSLSLPTFLVSQAVESHTYLSLLFSEV